MASDKTVILLYHDVDCGDSAPMEQDPADRELTVTVEEFERHMDCLAADGYRVCSLAEYRERRRRGDGSRAAVLTFDDGYMGNHRLALPVLRRHAFSATFFVVVERIGTPGYMGPRELSELVSAGMEVASHGVSHAHLTELDPEELRREVEGSKRAIESLVGGPVESFSYPGGFQDRRVREAVRRAGYGAAVSTIVGRNGDATDRWRLRRIEIRRGTGPAGFRRALSPTGIALFRGVDVAKTVLRVCIGLRNYVRLRRRLYFLYPFKR